MAQRKSWQEQDRDERVAGMTFGVVWLVVAVILIATRPSPLVWVPCAVACLASRALLSWWMARRHA